MIMFSSNEIKQTVKMKQCLKTAHSLFQTTCNTSLDLTCNRFLCFSYTSESTYNCSATKSCSTA